MSPRKTRFNEIAFYLILHFSFGNSFTIYTQNIVEQNSMKLRGQHTRECKNTDISNWSQSDIWQS